MSFDPQIKIPATYMRGGTSKGVFFNLDDLPEVCQTPGPKRDALLLRVIGSPDPYGKQTDGMGGATSSTSKTVIISKSTQPDHDIDYLFGQVSIDKPLVDWSGNCGNLTAAIGSFAISNGLIDSSKIPENGIVNIKIWQTNIKKTIIANVPIVNGEVQETGDFELDGVTFPSAEVKIEFINPVDANDVMFPTGNLIDQLDVPNVGTFTVTMINAGIPTIFMDAKQLDYNGTESQCDINSNVEALKAFEVIRAYGAVKMGLIDSIEEASSRQHTPKIVFIGEPQSYTTSSGKHIDADSIDLNVRALSMGLLHHAMMGTAAVAIGTAAAIPGTIVNQLVETSDDERNSVRFGHPSGTLTVGAVAKQKNNQWNVEKVMMSRSARILMEGTIRIPNDTLKS